MGANKISNLQKCGEILIDIKTKNRKNKIYVFHCTFCDTQCDQLKKFSLHLGEVHLNNSEDMLKETELKFEAEPEEMRIQTLTDIENMDIKKDFGSSTENKTLGNPDPLDTVDPKSSVSNNDILNCEIKCELKESSIDESTICEKDEMYCSLDDINKEANDKLEIFYTNSGDNSFVFDSDSEDEIKEDLDEMPLKKRKLNAAKKAKRLKQKTVKNEMSSDESKDADDNSKTTKLTAAERARRYREKIKLDKARNDEYKRKKKESNEKRMKRGDMPKKMLQRERAKNKEYVRAKKLKKAAERQMTDSLSSTITLAHGLPEFISNEKEELPAITTKFNENTSENKRVKRYNKQLKNKYREFQLLVDRLKGKLKDAETKKQKYKKKITKTKKTY